MVIEVIQNGKTYYMHTAWADSEDGDGISLEEYEGASFTGAYIDSDSTDSDDPTRYTWDLIEDPGADEEEQEDEDTDLSEWMEDMEDTAEDLAAEATSLGNDIEQTQGSSDEGIGHKNLLRRTNQGLEGWSSSGSILLSPYTDTVYTDVDMTYGITAECLEAGAGWISFSAEYFRSTLSDAPPDNSYTLSFDVQMSELFSIPISMRNVDGSGSMILFDPADNAPGDEEEMDNAGAWVRYESTGELLEVEADSQNLYFDLSEMPAGASISIVNLKAEEGAFATPWELDSEEVDDKVKVIRADLAVIGELLAAKATIKELQAQKAVLEQAVIGTGSASSFTAAKLTFTEAAGKRFTAEQVTTLSLAFDSATGGSISAETVDAHLAIFQEAIAGTFTADEIEAASAMFETAVLRQLYTDYLKATYADVGFANIGVAAVERLYTQFGVIDDIHIVDGKITGTLDSVTVNGDLIKANTIVADRIIFTGEDGMYYALNANGAGGLTPSQLEDPVYQHALSGKNLVANSVTADRIDVTDLFAQSIQFSGTISSKGKQTVKDNIKGVFIDGRNGTIGIGSGSGNHIWYDGEKVHIQADSLTFTSGFDVEQETRDAVDAVDSMQQRMDSGEFKGEDGTVLRIDSSRGTVFKNNSVNTVLTVAVYTGSHRITNISQLRNVYGQTAHLQWYWQKIGDTDYGIIVDSDHKLSNDGFTLTLTPEEVDTKVTFMCELII